MFLLMYLKYFIHVLVDVVRRLNLRQNEAQW